MAKDSKKEVNPMMSLMKNSAKKSSDSAAKTRNNYKETLAEAKKDKEEKDKEELDEAKKNSKARMMAGGDSPELIRARFIQAGVKYSLIIFLVAILGFGVVKGVPKLFSAAGHAVFDSMQGRR